VGGGRAVLAFRRASVGFLGGDGRGFGLFLLGRVLGFAGGLVPLVCVIGGECVPCALGRFVMGVLRWFGFLGCECALGGVFFMCLGVFIVFGSLVWCLGAVGRFCVESVVGLCEVCFVLVEDLCVVVRGLVLLRLFFSVVVLRLVCVLLLVVCWEAGGGVGLCFRGADLGFGQFLVAWWLEVLALVFFWLVGSVVGCTVAVGAGGCDWCFRVGFELGCLLLAVSCGWFLYVCCGLGLCLAGVLGVCMANG